MKSSASRWERLKNWKSILKNRLAWVELGIKKGIKVYDDASASIKTAGLIGDKFIKVDPGGSGDLLKPGGTITETSPALDIEDLIGKICLWRG